MSQLDESAAETTHKKGYVPGFAPLLVRLETKKSLQGFCSRNHLHDSHVERCLATACIEYALEHFDHDLLIRRLQSELAKSSTDIVNSIKKSSLKPNP